MILDHQTLTIQTKPSTLRHVTKIPKLPRDVTELSQYPIFEMQKGKMISDRLVFDNPDGLNSVLNTGFFLLEIPRNIDLTTSDLFVENFFKEKDNGPLDEYKGYKHVKINRDFQGYFDRPHDQWENFYIESEFWSSILPARVRDTGKAMANLGINVIRAIFNELGIPKIHWDSVSGKLTSYKGTQTLAYNHFRSDKKTRGCKLHRDSGWVTILRSTEPGLIALVNDKIYAINPTPGYFIVNFGSSFEVFTEYFKQPVRANIHGVLKTLKKPDGQSNRVSYTVFLDSDLSGDIFRYENNNPVKVQSMKEFSMQEVGRTYSEDNVL